MYPLRTWSSRDTCTCLSYGDTDLPVELLLVLHPHVLSERVILGDAVQNQLRVDGSGLAAESRVPHVSGLGRAPQGHGETRRAPAPVRLGRCYGR